MTVNLADGCVSSADLCHLSGATYRQIDYWTSTALIEPVGEPNPGSGRPRRYDHRTVAAVRRLAALSVLTDPRRREEALDILAQIAEGADSVTWPSGSTQVTITFENLA